MIVLRIPRLDWAKGLRQKVEGFWRAPQVPVYSHETNPPPHPGHLKPGCWLSPQRCSMPKGGLIPDLQALRLSVPADWCESACDGGTLNRKLELPLKSRACLRVSSAVSRRQKPQASWADICETSAT